MHFLIFWYVANHFGAKSSHGCPYVNGLLVAKRMWMQKDWLRCWPLVDFAVNSDSNERSEVGYA